ncbi:MAG: lipoprotein insertase outer membrane protein LolB [Pseudomonadales bacterium]
MRTRNFPFHPRCTLLLLSLLLSACATTPALLDSEWAKHQQDLAALSHWTMHGKIAIRHPDNNQSGYIEWQQVENAYQIRLYGPLGQGNILIEGKPGLTSLTTQDGRFSASNPETLLLQQTGMNLPVSDLLYWVKGLPAPNAEISAQTLLQGRLQQLTQNQWSINFSDYQAIGKQILPGKIQLQRDQLTIIVLAKNWTLDTLP